DEIDVLGSAVLGLTLKCARCHSHKFDPLPQRDYYRLLDVFKGAFDEYDWLKPDIRPGIGPVSQDVASPRHLGYVTTAERQAWEAEDKRLKQAIDALQTARKALDPSFKKETEEIERLARALQARRRPEPKVHALWDRGEPSPTYVYRRGDPLSQGRLV